jgi:carbamoyltransferase
MLVLGLSAFYHDSAAALVEDGRIIAAVQEERFSRKKFDERFPRLAIEYCLRRRSIRLRDLDYIAFYDKPFLKFERLLETYLAFAPSGIQSFLKAMPVWLGDKLFQKKELREQFATIDADADIDNKILFTEHHHAHAASAFFPSPFDEAVVLTLDGVGEWCTTSAALGNQSNLEIVKEIHFPHSLGLLYSAFTQYLGFRVNSGEYKVMGLAPYGVPRHRDRILGQIVDLKEDGSFKLDMSYFNYCTGLTMINPKFEQVFGLPTRDEHAPLTQEHMDIAASIQAALDEIMLRLTRSLAAEYGSPNLCLAGGVALNCVANGKILRDGKFKNIWIQPAAGDAGGALGAALATYHQFLGKKRLQRNRGDDTMCGAYLGPEFSQDEIEERLHAEGARFEVVADEDALVDIAARAISEGQAIGWAHGQMEFGPRSLGNRSILADPRSLDMQKVLNLKVKYRESFRPFAPSVLAEDAHLWFEIDRESPYMLLVADVLASRRVMDGGAERRGLDKLQARRSEIPAVTHVDYSARIQTVHRDTNPLFHKLLTRFKEITGCPILVNTSFNVRGEPIVCTPEDAFRCLMGTEIDLLFVGRCVLYKRAQNPNLKLDYRDAFDPD